MASYAQANTGQTLFQTFLNVRVTKAALDCLRPTKRQFWQWTWRCPSEIIFSLFCEDICYQTPKFIAVISWFQPNSVGKQQVKNWSRCHELFKLIINSLLIISRLPVSRAFTISSLLRRNCRKKMLIFRLLLESIRVTCVDVFPKTFRSKSAQNDD